MSKKEALPTTTTTTSTTTTTIIPVARPPPPPPRQEANAIKTYGALAHATLGPALGGAVSALQLLACWGLAVTYCVTGGASLASFFNFGTGALWALAFGVAQFPVAVVAPDLERLAGVSAGGAMASALYASAAVAASARALLMAKGGVSSSSGGMGGLRSEGGGSGQVVVIDDVSTRGMTTTTASLWSSLDAVSTILFAFGGHFVLPEIAAACSSPSSSSSTSSTSSSSFSSSSSSSSSSPSPSPIMLSAVKASYVAVALSYFSVAASGAAAFGRGVADDVLLSRGAGPGPLVAAANAAVCLHVAAGFHVFSQPCYSRFESWFRRREWRGRRVAAAAATAATTAAAAAGSTEAAAAAAASETPSPSSSSAFSLDSTAIAARAVYVLAVATAAAALPFFSVCMALVGALAFAPATFVLPPAFAYYWPPSTSNSSSSSSSSSISSKIRRRRTLHGAMAASFGVLSLACAISATRGLVVALERRMSGG